MSKVLRFQGTIDGSFEENNIFNQSALFERFGKPVIWRVTSKAAQDFIVTVSVLVVGIKRAEGWSIGLQNAINAPGFKQPIPDWQIYFESNGSVSPSLIMVVPDDATMELIL